MQGKNLSKEIPKVTDDDVADILEFWRNDPVTFVKDAIGVEKIDPKQEEILKALPFNKFIAVKSGHGVGKTALESWIILWFLTCYPECRIPVTAPTEDQLTKILWPEIFFWYNNSQLKEYIQWNKGKVFVIGEEQSAFAVPRTATKPDALQGFHKGNILFILEEASGIDDPIWTPMEGALTTANARALAFGNPTRPEGEFYRAFTDNAQFWKTFTISGIDSTLVSRDYIERMRLKYGEDSDVYRVRVLGEFPKQNSDAFIPLYICENSLKAEVEFSQRYKLGVDVARFGNDYTVWLIRGKGKIVYIERKQTMDTMQIAGRTIQLINEYRIDPTEVSIDSIGVGGGVVDRLVELNMGVNGVNVAESPYDDEMYLNKRVELWGIVKQELIDNRLNLTVGNDLELTNDLCGELATPKYKITSKGQYQLESKEDMKKRGVGSPDIADALILTYATNNTENEINILAGKGINYGESY